MMTLLINWLDTSAEGRGVGSQADRLAASIPAAISSRLGRVSDLFVSSAGMLAIIGGGGRFGKPAGPFAPCCQRLPRGMAFSCGCGYSLQVDFQTGFGGDQ
jgi:hypothetical protein